MKKLKQFKHFIDHNANVIDIMLIGGIYIVLMLRWLGNLGVEYHLITIWWERLFMFMVFSLVVIVAVKEVKK